MKTIRRAILLDCDGVLNCWSTTDIAPGTSYRGLDQDKVDRLVASAVEVGAKLVISSTWRKTPAMRRYLVRRLGAAAGLVLGDTPVLMVPEEARRASEILAWIELHPEVTHWVAVDDDQSVLALKPEHRVLTLERDGLTPALAAEIVAKLNPSCFVHRDRPAHFRADVPCAPGGHLDLCADCAIDPSGVFSEYQARHGKRRRAFTQTNPGS